MEINRDTPLSAFTMLENRPDEPDPMDELCPICDATFYNCTCPADFRCECGDYIWDCECLSFDETDEILADHGYKLVEILKILSGGKNGH